MSKRFITRALANLATLALTAVLVPPATAEQPIEIRMGVGTAAEEQAWLMQARPDLTPNQGKLYTYEMNMFRSGSDRMAAFQAGQLDAVTASTTGVLFAASKGVPLVVPVSMAKESTQTFSTSYLALKESDVSTSNLKGKTIGINGYRTSIELYARIAVEKAGLNPDRDVRWLIVPLPQMEEALRQKKIDLGVFPTTFAFIALRSGQFKRVFDSAGISGIEEEFDVAFNRDFVRKHPRAMQAWVSDFIAVTRYFLEQPEEARKSLLAAKIVQAEPSTYLAMTRNDDLLRSADVRPDRKMFERLQDELMRARFQEQKVDIGTLIDDSFLPK